MQIIGTSISDSGGINNPATIPIRSKSSSEYFRSTGISILQRSLLVFTVLFALFTDPLNAQTTISTTGYTGNGSGAGSGGSGITFSVTNNNGGGVILTEVGYSPGSTNTTELWYSSTSLTGTANVSTPTWTKIATVSSPTTIANTTMNTSFFTGLSLLIPGSTTYRFCVVVVPSTVRYHNPGGTPPATTVFTSGGVDMVVTNSLWGSQSSVGNTGRYYYGSITFQTAGPPCGTPSGLASSNHTSTSARLTWAPVPGSAGYDYHITTAATPPATGAIATTSTILNPTGLTPATDYNLFVRNKCNPPSQATSTWVLLPFKTNPPCTKRNIRITNITNSSAKISWNKEQHATQYEYQLKQDTMTPGTGTTLSADSSIEVKNLPEGTKYYFFVRMVCQGGELSPWTLDSFTTRIICRPPNLQVDNLNNERAVVYWDPVPSAIAYQYEVSQSPTPLGKGTRIFNRGFVAFPLKDNSVYYFHVKSECLDQGFSSESEWTTTSFKTWPTSVANTSNDPFVISVSPNPAKDQLTLSITGGIQGEARLTITDINGRSVQTTLVSEAVTKIDMSMLPSGIYLVKYSDAKHSQVFKITKE